MINTLLSILAPHHCSGCGKTGSLLCSNCKYNIVSEPFEGCLACQKPTQSKGLCNTCRVPYSRAWTVTTRKDVVQRLIDLYKFERTKSAYRPLGDLLLATLPVLPAETIIVPIPTIPQHIRERGYDHTLLLARYIAKRRGLKISTKLLRTSQTSQRGAKVRVREQQAMQAFGIRGSFTGDQPYLLIDDIYTTGSTMKHAALTLKAAGATDVWVAIIARQTLD